MEHTLKIYYHDGSFQLTTPKQEMGVENRFNNDWKGLAETIAGRHKKDKRPYLKHEIL